MIYSGCVLVCVYVATSESFAQSHSLHSPTTVLLQVSSVHIEIGHGGGYPRYCGNLLCVCVWELAVSCSILGHVYVGNSHFFYSCPMFSIYGNLLYLHVQER